jgi:hypothetical protein
MRVALFAVPLAVPLNPTEKQLSPVFATVGFA